MTKADRERLTPEDVLGFWFGEDTGQPLAMAARWFAKDAAFDAEIGRRFGRHMAPAAAGQYDGWRRAPRSALALILMLDQFSRNIHRDASLAFAQDDLALQICMDGLEKGFDERLQPMEAVFLIMPLMHSESPAHQQRSVEKYAELARRAPEPLREALANNHKYALSHQEIIVRFGRFPHRNALLGRAATPEEEDYLKDPDAGF